MTIPTELNKGQERIIKNDLRVGDTPLSYATEDGKKNEKAVAAAAVNANMRPTRKKLAHTPRYFGNLHICPTKPDKQLSNLSVLPYLYSS